MEVCSVFLCVVSITDQFMSLRYHWQIKDPACLESAEGSQSEVERRKSKEAGYFFIHLDSIYMDVASS